MPSAGEAGKVVAIAATAVAGVAAMSVLRAVSNYFFPSSKDEKDIEESVPSTRPPSADLSVIPSPDPEPLAIPSPQHSQAVLTEADMVRFHEPFHVQFCLALLPDIGKLFAS